MHRERGTVMFTVTDIVSDISRGCAVNNLNEDRFLYRVIFYTNEHGIGTRHYIDTAYGDLQKKLENIIRNNLSLTNTVVIAQTTVLLNGKCVCLQSRSYGFSLEEYFRQLAGKSKNGSRKGNITYGRYAVR